MPSISYKHLQGSGLVRAGAVGSFTRPNVRQLVIFKEMALEIWETEEESPIKVAGTEIWLNVCNCVLLQSPWDCGNLSSTTLDRILVTDDKGNISVLEWSISCVKNASIEPLCAHRDKMEPVLYHSKFSNPLRLRGDTPLSSLVERSREMEVGAKDWSGKIGSITLVAMAVFEGLIHVLVAAWVPVTRYQSTSFQGTISHRLFLNEYHLKMKEEPGIANIASQLRKVPTILGLAFMEGLDWKAHPLLVVLSAQDGLIYELVTVECFALDLAEKKILQGPWRISNLHATSRFLLPWCQVGITSAQHNCDATARANESMEETGVLVISSRGLLFISLGGCRASLSFTMHLDGPPTCVEIIKDRCLVLGDSSGVLYVVDLKEWDHHLIQQVKGSNSYSPANILLLLAVREDERTNMMHYKFFSSGKTSNLRFFSLYPPSMGGPGLGQDPFLVDEKDGLSRKPPAVSSRLPCNADGSMNMPEVTSWYTVESRMKLNSEQDFTCVRDMILINNPQQSPEQQILVACGSAPNATIRRGTFGVSFNKIRVLEDKICGLPQLIPIKGNVHSDYHTHILLSYPTQDRTEIITMEGEMANESCIQELDREHCTLAALVVSGDWLVQVTSYSLRVLSFSEPRSLVAEWIPPVTKASKGIAHGRHGRERSFSHNIVHASLCIDGAVLATYDTLYSITLSKSGRVQMSSTNVRNHEVSALGVFEFWIAGESAASGKKKKLYARHLTSPRATYESADLSFVVVVAQWHTNTVHVLTWPDLEEMTSIEAESAPVRCVHVVTLGNKQYLVVGSSDGLVIYFEIKYEIPKTNTETQYSTMNAHTLKCGTSQCPSSSRNEAASERENLSCLTLMSHLRTPLCHNNDYDQNLKRFTLKLLTGKRLKLGGSIEYMVSGPICGQNFDSTGNMKLEHPDCLLLQGDQNVVLCSKEDGQLQALYVWGTNQPLAASSSWQVKRLLGTPQQLAHHRGSGCIAISSNDGGSVRLSFMNIQSMCQVLTLEVGTEQHPTALKAMELPCVKTEEVEACKQCIVLASQKGTKEPAQGTIYFFEFNQRHSGNQEIQYELSLLGVHCTDLPCHAMCLLGSQRESLPSGVCDICNISTFVEDFEPLASALKHLSHGSHHWNDCFRHQEDERGLRYHSGPLLVLGYKGRVEMFSIVVGNNLTSILLAPSLANAAKVAVPSLSGPIFLEGYESSSPYVSDTESEHEDGPKCSNIQAAEVSTQPSQELKSLICLTKITELESPGRSCVTAIVSISQRNFLVVEMLRGVGAFSIQGNTEVLLLAWHPFSQPILDLIPINPDLYLVSTYEKGLQLMGRNYAAEQSFQDEEKRLREEDVERGLVGGSQRRLDTDGRGHELPGFNVIASQPSPATVLRVQEGDLDVALESINPELKLGSFSNWHGITITPIGEVGVIEIFLNERT